MVFVFVPFDVYSTLLGAVIIILAACLVGYVVGRRGLRLFAVSAAIVVTVLLLWQTLRIVVFFITMTGFPPNSQLFMAGSWLVFFGLLIGYLVMEVLLQNRKDKSS